MGLHIRDCRETDADALRALARGMGLAPASVETSALRLILADRRQTLLVALEGEQVVGAIHLAAEGAAGRICQLLLPGPGSAARPVRDLLAEAGLWLASRGAGQMQTAPPVEAVAGADRLTAAGFSKGPEGVWTKPLSRARQAS